MAAKVRAIGYLRVSTDVQAERGFGLDVQRQALQEYCRESGFRLVATFADEGLSGSNGLDTREGLAEALSRLETGEAAVLVVYRLDRLARKLALQETIIERLGTVGVNVLSVTEPDINGDETRDLVRQVFGAIAQYERAVIRRRMTAGRALKRKRGGYADGRPPFGFIAERGELVPDEREQQVIRHARRLHAQGKSLREIAVQLEGKGFRRKDGKTRWHPTQVARIVSPERLKQSRKKAAAG